MGNDCGVLLLALSRDLYCEHLKHLNFANREKYYTRDSFLRQIPCSLYKPVLPYNTVRVGKRKGTEGDGTALFKEAVV
jgi:hypothetical protein